MNIQLTHYIHKHFEYLSYSISLYIVMNLAHWYIKRLKIDLLIVVVQQLGWATVLSSEVTIKSIVTLGADSYVIVELFVRHRTHVVCT